MAAFIETITGLVTGVFKALLDALGGIGQVIFTIGENGSISGVTGFGQLLAVGIGLPLVTWLFTKLWAFIRSIGRAGK